MYRLLQVFVALRVLVVGPYKDTLLSSRHSKRTDASHDIGHDLAGLEQGSDTVVLVTQLRVPVDFGIVKLEGASALANLDEHIVGPGQDLVGKGAELVLCADIVRLVDDGPEVGVLIQDNLGDDVLIG